MKDNEKNEEEKNEEDISSFPKLIKVTDNSSSHKYIFRICLLGDSGVGKTSLLTRYCDSIFKDKYSNTIGVDFRVVTLKYKDILTKIHIWDTAGQERFKSISVNYFKSSHGFIFVYDITNKESFDNLNNWIDLAFQNNQNSIVNFLIGNKCDLESDRKIDIEEGKNFAEQKKFIFLETSAKDDININKVFEFFTYKLIYYFQKNQDKYEVSQGERLTEANDISIDEDSNENNKKSGCIC
jgi:Ras-related protein Rab-1A